MQEKENLMNNEEPWAELIIADFEEVMMSSRVQVTQTSITGSWGPDDGDDDFFN